MTNVNTVIASQASNISQYKNTNMKILSCYDLVVFVTMYFFYCVMRTVFNAYMINRELR